MALFNALDKTAHFGEFSLSAYVNGVLKTSAERIALALANLGMAPLETEAGAGVTGGTGTVYQTTVVRRGGIIKTEIMIDLTGLASIDTDKDIIGVGTSPAHFGQITAAQNGTILFGRMTCLEVPAVGADDIDVYSATEGTGVLDGAVEDLTQTVLKTKSGAWAVDLPSTFVADVVADQYIYLCSGEAVAGTYTAGKFLIELWGYDA